MQFFTWTLFLTLVCGAISTCPPPGFDSVSPFDIDAYIATSWYIQEQRPLFYQPESRLFCVVASYELQNPEDPSEGLTVFNYANADRVNGEVSGTSGIAGGEPLQANIPDPEDPSKLRVGPQLLETLLGPASNVFYGDYWVVAVGPISDPAVGYDWAIVSGGPPTLETENGCRTGRRFLPDAQTNGIGFWLFSRKPIDPEGTAEMRRVAADLGFDLSVLRPVEHEGCLYEGALIK